MHEIRLARCDYLKSAMFLGTDMLYRVTLSMGVVQRKEETSGVALTKRADLAMNN